MRCTATLADGSRRCKRPALAGSKFCVVHDPARKDERDANLARAREARLR